MRSLGLPALLLGLILGFCFAAPATHAAPLVQVDTSKNSENSEKDPSQLGSLMRVPHSAGFYFATMNHEAISQAVTKSNAWRAIKKSEVARGMKSAYRRGRTKGYAEYNEENPFAQYLKFYGETFDNFIVQSGWEIGRQVVGNEMFIYVDNDMASLIEVARKAQLEAYESFAQELDIDELRGDMSDESTMLAKVGPQIMAEMLKKLTDVGCPTMIIGARLEDPEGFKGMLELLKSGVEVAMNELPPEAQFLRDSWEGRRGNCCCRRIRSQQTRLIGDWNDGQPAVDGNRQ